MIVDVGGISAARVAISAGLMQLDWENRRNSCGERRLTSVGLAQLVWVLTPVVLFRRSTRVIESAGEIPSQGEVCSGIGICQDSEHSPAKWQWRGQKRRITLEIEPFLAAVLTHIVRDEQPVF